MFAQLSCSPAPVGPAHSSSDLRLPSADPATRVCIPRRRFHVPQPRPIVHLVLSALILSTLLLALAAPAQAQRSFTEDFTTTTYRDAANTTAVWDTGTETLHLPPFTPSIIGTNNTVVDAWELEIVGDLAFIADGISGLRIMDITDPTSPVQLGVIDTPVSVHDLCVDGDLVYLADGPTGMLIVDISDPTTPTLLGTYNSPGAVRDIVLSGKYAIVADDSAGIRVVDVSNPAAPLEVGFVDFPGIARGLDISGNKVYVANGDNSFIVVDISDPTIPILLGGCTTLNNAVDVVVSGDFAYVADGALGFTVIYIADPALPVRKTTMNTGDYTRGIAVDGNYLYVADGTSGLQIFDIIDPIFPTALFTIDTPGTAFGVDVDGELAYVADLSGGLQVVRVSHRVGPAWGGDSSLPAIPEAMAVSGDLLVIAAGVSGIVFMDITDPTDPIALSSLPTTGAALDVVFDGNHVYAVGDDRELRVIDITDPANPIEVGSITAVDNGQGVAVTGDRVYVAARGRGLDVFDVSDPTTPTRIGFYALGGITHDIVISGTYAYVCRGTSGFWVMDISPPGSPIPLGFVDTPGEATRAVVSGRHAYVADSSGGLRIIDVSDPSTPVEVAAKDVQPSLALDVAVAGNYVFVAGSTRNLNVFDITDPSNPINVTWISTGGTGHAIALSGHHAFLGTDAPSVQVREIFQSVNDSPSNRGQSIDVASLDENILKVRMTGTYTWGTSWRFFTDGGTTSEPIYPSGGWFTPTYAISSDLRWRADLNYTRQALYASEITLEWLIDAPIVNSVEDIPNDQGRQVRVEWARSGHDFVGDAQQITEYAVYRQIEAGLKQGAPASTCLEFDMTALSPAAQEHALLMTQAGWDFITTVPVRVEDYYAVVAPTLADSSIVGGQQLSTFMVSALTATPGVYFDSDPVSGYSVDNLAPGVPKNIIAGYAAPGTQLDWDDALEEDFQLFRVYRDTQPGFTPSPQNLIQEVAGSQWSDANSNPWGFFYQISAVDHAGNEGPVGAPGVVTDAPIGTRSTTYALQEAMPNPFNPSTTITYSTPRAGQVVLEIYDLAGRHVSTLVDEHVTQGEHLARWNGMDDTGAQVSSGVYLYQLRAGEFIETKRMVLLK